MGKYINKENLQDFKFKTRLRLIKLNHVTHGCLILVNDVRSKPVWRF